jgi:hypothetical protein
VFVGAAGKTHQASGGGQQNGEEPSGSHGTY